MSHLIWLETAEDEELLTTNKSYQLLLAILNAFDYNVSLVKAVAGQPLAGAIGKASDDLPSITLDQLAQPARLENYLVQLMAMVRLNALQQTLKKADLLTFHSHYKLLLLAHSQPDYRQIGPYVAQIKQLTLDEFLTYRRLFLALLAKGSTISNHVNTLQHIQGYFRPHLSALQKQQLADLINAYRLGQVPLLRVIEELNHYLALYPHSYLSHQYYLTDYPKLLSFCYST